MDIAPGTTICVEVNAVPRNAAATKTLTRILCKDPAIARQQRRRKQRRPSLQTSTRGGRMWRHHMKSKAPVQLQPGAKYTMQASVDLIRDLQSVKRWINVSPA